MTIKLPESLLAHYRKKAEEDYYQNVNIYFIKNPFFIQIISYLEFKKLQ